MYQIVQDMGTGHWYGFAAGYWHHIANDTELAQAARSPLCVNGAAVRAAIAKPAGKRNTRHYGLSTAQTLARKAFATGNGK